MQGSPTTSSARCLASPASIYTLTTAAYSERKAPTELERAWTALAKALTNAGGELAESECGRTGRVQRQRRCNQIRDVRGVEHISRNRELVMLPVASGLYSAPALNTRSFIGDGNYGVWNNRTRCVG